ncbi:MAG: DUF4838 domain-containing protein, partial [Lentisphaerae bacterium]|nr:DUF4838 domain-containing protein [Lentisphaerota bacterium]
AEPIGVLYGAYEVLKRYGGIRWLVPGDDGEYFTVKPTIAVPEMDIISNPSFEFRTINWAAASILSPIWDSWDWMVRNNLRPFEGHHTYLNEALHDGLAARGAEIQAGGHCFSNLLGGNNLGGKTRARFKQDLETLYREHPEYFPVINGRRVILENQKYQPCTTHPEVVRIMSENLVGNLREFCSQSPAGRYRLVNDDGTGWCECEKCRAQDPADETAGRLVVTRYWSFINQLAEKACAAVPGARINSIAYQNYQAAPKHVLPSQSLSTVELSYNSICYRHALDDPSCLANRKYYQQYLDWAALAKQHGYRLVAYAQIDSLGAVNMPIEDVFVHDIKLYHKLGIIGLRPQLEPVDGKYSDARSHYKETWYGMWQTLYLFTQYAWDIDRDYPSIYEEINTLYYGDKAWEAGMRDFRALLRQAFQETPGCYGHGHSSPLGRCLDKPGVQDTLLRHLAAAEAAAAGDPDPRALRHVQRERALFARTWEKFRSDYLANYREITAYRKSAPIAIDGVLDEPDWRNADVTSNFKLTRGDGLAKAQTYVRVTYEPEAIYFGVEAMEPDPDQIKAEITEHDGPVWTDSTVELFLTHPDLGASYYQLIFNAKGTVFDRFVRPGSDPDVAFE